MLLQEAAKLFVESNFDKIQFGRTFDRYELKNERTAPDGTKGLYFIYKYQCNLMTDRPYYIGETFARTSCINKRIYRHKKSLLDPEWKGERTGIHFLKKGIDLDQKFDIYYIVAESIGIFDKKSSISAETLFMTHLKPLVWNF